MKGLILAGGKATRMDPISRVVNKHLLPIYNKPVIYYPLSTLIAAGVDEVLVITTEEHIQSFRHLLGSGDQFGIRIFFECQSAPKGLPEAFIIGEKFIDGEPVALILGDNLFWGPLLQGLLDSNTPQSCGATIFTRRVEDPRQFGVLLRDSAGKPIGIVEKPADYSSQEAVTGFYFFPSDVVEHARGLKPSARQELEITDLLRIYLESGRLDCVFLGSSDEGIEWYDAGTPDNLVLASTLVRGAEHDGLLVGSPEAAAYKKQLISKAQLLELAGKLGNEVYARNLKALAGP